MVAFIRDFLGPALAAQGLAVPVMAPETQGWNRFQGYADPLMADPGAVAIMGPLATHHYAGTPYDYAAAKAAGKVMWETECDDGAAYDPQEPQIDSGLRVAQMIHDNLVLGGVSAWHYWWLIPSGPSNAALTLNNALLKRAWVLGNWSRFVRPGYLRVAATAHPQESVFVSGFVDQVSGRVVVVAMNHGYADATQDFAIAGGTVDAMTPWVTSAGLQLAAQGSVAVTDGTFTATLPQRSVTSFVGTVAR
jgi:glucuronoarabinoxylan endo-1,4-beta-xylanase